MAISTKTAVSIFRAEASTDGPIDAGWSAKVEELSRLCEAEGSSTHIAFLVTSILAKAVDGDVDLYAIKPTHAKGNPNAYSARSLCHNVIVPLAAELGVNLGVTGREPLNNQPYFRMTRLGDGTPVHSRAQPAFDYMLALIEELTDHTSAHARRALCAFISVRRRYQVVYTTSDSELAVSWATLAQAIADLVADSSEGGRRAQAAVAGLFDVFAGADRVDSGKINDPSRHYPGDVAVRSVDGGWEKAVEVRDKVVSEPDVHIFGRNCLARGVREAAMLLVAQNQPSLNDATIATWAAHAGLGLTLFYGWPYFVDQVLFWSVAARVDSVALAVERIEARLISVEASSDAVKTWHRLTRTANDGA